MSIMVAASSFRILASGITAAFLDCSFSNSIADALVSAGRARRPDFQAGALFSDFRWNSTSYSKRLTFGTIRPRLPIEDLFQVP